jgi:hypothetical protein
MKVTIQNHPKVTDSLVAWYFSRPKETEASLKEILALDLPVNEFVPLHLQIESTIFEREIIATMRDHVMWAQTSRVQDVLEFEVNYDDNSGLKYHAALYEDMRSKMKFEAQAGVPQDEYRLHLPMVSTTKYSINVSLRGIVKIAKYFRHLSYMCPQFSQQFRKFAGIIFNELESFFQMDIEKITRNYKPYHILNEELLAEGQQTGSKIDGIIFNRGDLPLHLRAQLVRHRKINVKDGFFHLMKTEHGLQATLNTVIPVISYGDKYDFIEVLEKRSCWVAHYRIWGSYLGNIEHQMDGVMSLPCKNGTCPFSADAVLRFEGKDPNPPCPLHCTLNGLKPSLEQIERMEAMVINDNRSTTFWNPVIEKTKEM